ncbi:unnamed protein product [Allacma fusca]|uniref:Uncharacterized protein n=1 Tax=Allacma fusca TaxID=39272 RepID=A0A8J2K4A1_9HEXA|nr:unnamed protein product [Allacma fusca]
MKNALLFRFTREELMILKMALHFLIVCNAKTMYLEDFVIQIACRIQYVHLLRTLKQFGLCPKNLDNSFQVQFYPTFVDLLMERQDQYANQL